MTTPRYRIGYLNPWREKAENHAFGSLREAAGRLGHDFIHVTTSDEIMAANLDFVIAVASVQPKLTAVPTFGAIHEPRTRFWEKSEYFQNLLTYDGYMTIADSLHGFLDAFCAGVGKPQHVGYYYNTPQRQTIEADVEGLAARGQLSLCYFGTNWDPRTRPLFRTLVKRDYMRVYGPKESWDYLKGEKYFGSPAFDGNAVQREYAAHGVGLAVLSRGHALDDVISNRIFEIASVGAVAICPDIPWIRRHFGDGVYYFDPNGTVYEIFAAIDAAMAAILADPADAARRAKAARAVFERDFAAEEMVANAVRYFEEWKTLGGLPQPPSASPPIDVIVRVGGRPLDTIKRALDSLETQTAGRFRVIFVRYRDLDLAPLVEAPWTRIESFRIVDRIGGDRAATMTEGLKAVTAPYFALLDDDDFLLPGHFEALLRQITDAPEDRLFAYSGFLEVQEPEAGASADRERRRIFSLAPAAGDAWSITGAFAPNGFLASSALLTFLDLDGWSMRTSEDTLLIATLAAHGEPRFSYRATACHVVGSHGASNFVETPTRQEDVLETFLRMQTLFDRLERNFGKPSMSNWERLGWQLHRVLEAKSRERMGKLSLLVLEEGVLASSIHDRDDLDVRPIPINPVTVECLGECRLSPTAEGFELVIHPEALPWAYGAVMDLDKGQWFSGVQWIVAEFEPVYQSFGVGVLNAVGDGFQTRTEVPASRVPVEIWLHIHDAKDTSRLILQNWAEPVRTPARLKALWVVRETLAGAVGERSKR
jgi:hypothetical protein